MFWYILKVRREPMHSQWNEKRTYQELEFLAVSSIMYLAYGTWIVVGGFARESKTREMPATFALAGPWWA